MPPPTDSFAWKDSTLERQLKELKERQFSDAPDPKSGRDGANDKGLGKSLQNWADKPLPKVIKISLKQAGAELGQSQVLGYSLSEKQIHQD